jgi:hypothetical protein
MKKLNIKAGILPFALAAVLLSVIPVSAQDDFGFGFGFDDESGEGIGGSTGGSSGGSFITGASIGGTVSAGLQFFFDDAGDLDKLKAARLSDIFTGALNFKATGSNADAVINLKLSPNFAEPTQIVSIDEAYLRAFFGNFNIEGGLRKLTWGKADTLGPLDVINPLDYTDLSSMSDPQAIKIARPLLHASYGFGSFSKVEGVFLPWFEGARFSQDGRWAPAQVTKMAENIEGKILSDMNALMGGMPPALAPLLAAIPSPIEGIPAIDQGEILPDTSTLEYFQGGLRFTTTIGPADLGLQYYSGFLSRPAVKVNQTAYDALLQAIQAYYTNYVTAYMGDIGGGGTPTTAASAGSAAAASAQAAVQAALNPAQLLDTAYNRYHQIGVDYAQVLFGFNLRAELATNITADLDGDDGLVYNPSIAWSLGFDRDLFAGINLNLQVNESVRLFDDKVGADPLFDIEAGTDITSTRLTASLSRSFFRNELELRGTVIWGLEDQDFYIIPAVTWTRGDVTLECSAGIFAGNKEGELGQYRDNAFVKTVLSYSF